MKRHESGSWHGSRPPEENHIVVAAYRERDEARAESDYYREALEMIAKGEVGDWSDGDARRVLVLREIAREALDRGKA